MLKRLIIFITLLCFAVAGTAFAATSRTLDKNTELHPQGWSVGETIKFKKNTAVRLNDNGEVISGTLADDTYLRPHGWQRIINDHYFVSAYTGRRGLVSAPPPLLAGRRVQYCAFKLRAFALQG